MIYKRLQGVTSSAGYSLAITYLTNVPGTGTEPQPNWYIRTGVTFNNSANPPSPVPTISYAKAGQVGAEAVGQWHAGRAVGEGPVRLIVIDLVPPGVNNTIMKPTSAAR